MNIKGLLTRWVAPKAGYTEAPDGLHFNGVPVEVYDDGHSAAERAEKRKSLISFYTDPWHVYCTHCGQIDQLGNMAMCQTCGDAWCPDCTARYPEVQTAAYGKGIVCPTCRNLQRFGIACV